MFSIENKIRKLSHQEVLELLFNYSDYVILQLKEYNQPVCVMEYFEHDWKN